MINSKFFGKTKLGEDVTLYTIDNGVARVSVMDYGATLVSFEIKDGQGKFVDTILGFDDVSGYENNKEFYLGATVGRYANRIEGARFTLNGREYLLPINNSGKHCHHGGPNGFSFRMFNIEASNDSICASILSPDMDEGFPGNMDFTVKYTLTQDSLEIEYSAISDKDTVANFTNHSYFNLNGSTSNTTILNHTLQINSPAYCECDFDGLATGDIHPVDNTPFDFREPKLLADVIGIEHPLLKPTDTGIDNTFVLCTTKGEPSKIATLYNPDNNIKIDCLTDFPGLHVYTATFLKTTGREGTPYNRFSGICLEAQGFPNAAKYRHFPSPFLSANEKFSAKTVFKFSVQDNV